MYYFCLSILYISNQSQKEMLTINGNNDVKFCLGCNLIVKFICSIDTYIIFNFIFMEALLKEM